jgi:hypothetical protein
VTPAPTLDERVQAALEAHRAVDRELEALVALELQQRTNGSSANGAIPPLRTAGTPPMPVERAGPS